jgi:hypothetical protein
MLPRKVRGIEHYPTNLKSEADRFDGLDLAGIDDGDTAISQSSQQLQRTCMNGTATHAHNQSESRNPRVEEVKNWWL